MLRLATPSSVCTPVRGASAETGYAESAAPGAPLSEAFAPVVAPKLNGLPRWRLQRALDYIEQNLAAEIRLSDLADAARLSVNHFSELFRQSTGTSPYRYVLTRRVECAKRLLGESMLGVLDIALAVGFSDQSHFSKVFRRATGMTPGGYRAVMWAEGVSPTLAIPEDRTNGRTNVLTLEQKALTLPTTVRSSCPH
jgi:AraC-like DNA-binding protein